MLWANSLSIIVKNPITIWLKWIFSRIYLQHQYRKKKLRIGYLSFVDKSSFGIFNTIQQKCYLNKVELGDFTYIASDSKVNRCIIGKFCSIGSNCKIGLGRHPSKDFVSTHPIFYSTHKQAQVSFSNKDYFSEFKDILIGNDVWIGSNVIIVDGITINDGAIIAAGAVVTKDVPPYAIVGGIPAKIIRYRFDHSTIKFLQDFKWWDKDINWLQKNYKFFHDVQCFIDEFATPDKR